MFQYTRFYLEITRQARDVVLAGKRCPVTAGGARDALLSPTSLAIPPLQALLAESVLTLKDLGRFERLKTHHASQEILQYLR